MEKGILVIIPVSLQLSKGQRMGVSRYEDSVEHSPEGEQELNHKQIVKQTQACISTSLRSNLHHPKLLTIKSEMRSFKSNENIHKKEGGSYYVVSANKASSVTL